MSVFDIIYQKVFLHQPNLYRRIFFFNLKFSSIKPNNDTLYVCCVYRLQIFATAQTLISTEFEKKDISTSTNKLDILIFNS